MSAIGVDIQIDIFGIVMGEAFYPIFARKDSTYHCESLKVIIDAIPPENYWHGAIRSAAYLWDYSFWLKVLIDVDALSVIFHFTCGWVFMRIFGFLSSLINFCPCWVS